MHYFFRKKANGTLGEIIVENKKSTIQVSDTKNVKGSIPFFTSGDSVNEWPEPLVNGRNCFLNTGGNAGIKYYIGEAAYSTDTWCITSKNKMEDYLFLFLLSIKPELDKKYFLGTGLKHLQKPLLKTREVYIPSKTELDMFNSIISPSMNTISSNIREIDTLKKLRDWLLPMLMNGQATIED